MATDEEFSKLSYEEQLKELMRRARVKVDIWMMLVIDEKMKELRKEEACGLPS